MSKPFDATLFCMEVNPETGRKTARFEVELTDVEFFNMKRDWADDEKFKIQFKED